MSPRSYQTFPFDNLGKGLNLRAKPDAVSPAECIDVMNELYADRGAIEPRGGYEKLTEAALTNRVDSLEPFYTAGGGTRQLVAGCGTRLEAIGSGGNLIASATGLKDLTWDFARYGKPNGEVVYCGNGEDTLRRWDGSAFTAPTATVDEVAGKAMPKGGALASWPAGGNRLAVARFLTATGGPNGGISSVDHIYLSDPGDPTSWTSNNFVQLSPGDGERIQAVIGWRELLFVFKETKFFVFDGEGVDAEGNPEFLFHPVEGGAGLAAPQAVCAHPTGVYFMGRHGVYRTTGQEAELLSSDVEPIWEGEPSVFYTGGVIAHGSIDGCAMTAFDERIYLSFPTAAVNDRTLVFDPRYEWWSLTDLPCAAMTSFRAGVKEELAFGLASGENHVALHGPTYENDDGEAIVSYWRSGWFDLGNPDEKKIRATKAWGTGKVQCGVSADFTQSKGLLALLDFSEAEGTQWNEDEWGAGEWAKPKGLREAQRRIAVRGTVFSVYFENRQLNQDYSIHRLEHLVPEVRDPAKAGG